MEYSLCRGMEINRLLPENLDDLHERERKYGRCYYPWEIQKVFHLPLLKEHYSIAFDNEQAQAIHANRLRTELKIAGINLFLSPVDVESVHEFDNKIMLAMIDYEYHGARAGKRKTDQIESEL